MCCLSFQSLLIILLMSLLRSMVLCIRGRLLGKSILGSLLLSAVFAEITWITVMFSRFSINLILLLCVLCNSPCLHATQPYLSMVLAFLVLSLYKHDVPTYFAFVSCLRCGTVQGTLWKTVQVSIPLTLLRSIKPDVVILSIVFLNIHLKHTKIVINIHVMTCHWDIVTVSWK